FVIDEVDGVDQRRRREIIVLRRDEDEGVGRVDAPAPFGRVWLLVLAQPRMLRFVVDRQVEGREIDQGRLEFAVLTGEGLEPFGDQRPDSAGASAADYYVEARRHARFSWKFAASR